MALYSRMPRNESVSPEGKLSLACPSPERKQPGSLQHYHWRSLLSCQGWVLCFEMRSLQRASNPKPQTLRLQRWDLGCTQAEVDCFEMLYTVPEGKAVLSALFSTASAGASSRLFPSHAGAVPAFQASGLGAVDPNTPKQLAVFQRILSGRLCP